MTFDRCTDVGSKVKWPVFSGYIYSFTEWQGTACWSCLQHYNSVECPTEHNGTKYYVFQHCKIIHKSVPTKNVVSGCHGDVCKRCNPATECRR